MGMRPVYRRFPQRCLSANVHRQAMAGLGWRPGRIARQLPEGPVQVTSAARVAGRHSRTGRGAQGALHRGILRALSPSSTLEEEEPNPRLQVDERIVVYGGYDHEPEWLLANPSGYPGEVGEFIPGQNEQPAVVVARDEELVLPNGAGAVRGQLVCGKFVVLELGHVGTDWAMPPPRVHVELCEERPPPKRWQIESVAPGSNRTPATGGPGAGDLSRPVAVDIREPVAEQRGRSIAGNISLLRRGSPDETR